jgi:hypothetical protein
MSTHWFAKTQEKGIEVRTVKLDGGDGGEGEIPQAQAQLAFLTGFKPRITPEACVQYRRTHLPG